MNILIIILVIIVLSILWGLMSYLFLWLGLKGFERAINSPKATDEKIIKLGKYIKFNNYFTGIVYGGIIGYFLAKNKFIPKQLDLFEKKLKERNITL